MRRQHFLWTYLVFAIVLFIYGGYSIIYSSNHHKDVPILAVVFIVIGSIMLITTLILYLFDKFKKSKVGPVEETKEEVKKVEEASIKPQKTVSQSTYTNRPTSRYERSTPRKSFDGGSGYVKLVGYGPVLRVNDEEILDMRNNTYYRIEGHIIKMMGSGPVYEISGNKIKLAFGGYLYEVSGSNINKIYGGYYASISGGYLQTHDLKEKYEIPTDLNRAQILLVVALLFGTY